MHTNRVSRWSRWDLHVHTRASNVKKENKEYFGNGTSFSDDEIEEFVEKIFFDDGPKLIAITDHDFFDYEQFLKIKKTVYEKSKKRKEDLCCLPGLECDVYFKMDKHKKIIQDDRKTDFVKSKRVHLIIIFNDTDWDSTKYKNLKTIVNELYKNDDPLFINSVIEKFVDNKLEFIVIPHFDKTNGIESAIPDNVGKNPVPENMQAKTNWILSGYFPLLDGVKKDFINEQTKEFYQMLNSESGYSIPEILTSDNHNYRTYGSNLNISWYKAIPSFKGLKMCCSDYAMRVKFDPAPPVSSYISRIEIKNVEGYDLINEDPIQLSENLNCLIGGRSSGKSLLLKKIMQSCDSANKNIEDLKNYKKYNEHITVDLYDNVGEKYKGIPEYISQGSIISKYINDNNNTNLAIDFKDEFPNYVNTNTINNDKNEIVSIVTSIDETLNKICSLSQNLRKKNFYNYLQISNVSLENSISNSTIISQCSAEHASYNNLKEFKDGLEKTQHLVLKYPKIISKIKDLSHEVNLELKLAEKRLHNYDVIKNASNNLISMLDIATEGYNKKIKTQLAAVSSASKDVFDWCHLYSLLNNNVVKLKKIIAKLKQSNIESNTFGTYKFAIKITNNISINDIFDIFIKRVKDKDIREKTKNFNSLIEKSIFSKYDTFASKKLNNMIYEYLEQKYLVEYLIYENNELINNMSEGRKVSAFLSILLNKSNSIEPLIIDQPEDDMDNNDIYSVLVSLLRKRKETRQIIIATHDANVVVNGDAENVIVAEKNKKRSNKIYYRFGGLEYDDQELNIQKTICDILEGGEVAFINRAAKYDLDKTKIYKWKGKKI